jgi:hypothetical protein
MRSQATAKSWMVERCHGSWYPFCSKEFGCVRWHNNRQLWEDAAATENFGTGLDVPYSRSWQHMFVACCIWNAKWGFHGDQRKLSSFLLIIGRNKASTGMKFWFWITSGTFGHLLWLSVPYFTTKKHLFFSTHHTEAQTTAYSQNFRICGIFTTA